VVRGEKQTQTISPKGIDVSSLLPLANSCLPVCVHSIVKLNVEQFLLIARNDDKETVDVDVDTQGISSDHLARMLGWLNNLFTSNGNSLNARRKTAMSTHDAFSLPTSSPVNSMHPRDSFARYGSPSPDPESSSNAPSYAYPPPSSSSSPTNYDYIPSFKCVFTSLFLIEVLGTSY
jgi:hypothetical protein